MARVGECGNGAVKSVPCESSALRTKPILSRGRPMIDAKLHSVAIL